MWARFLRPAHSFRGDEPLKPEYKLVVIGENQARVELVAWLLGGAETIKPLWPPELLPRDGMTRAERMALSELGVAFNRAWVRDKMAQGYVFLDIGRDPERFARILQV